MVRLPRITIITPSYNQASFLEQTIESVLAQDYPGLEYIVIDGGSTDDTVSLLKKYNSLLTWISESDRGQSHAINKGFKMATGDVVAFLNSDDLLLPGALRKVGQFFSNHPDAAWVTGRCRIIDKDNQEIRKTVTLYKNMWLKLANYRTLQITNYISQMATFWRREVFESIGEFDESLHYTMDYDYWMRIGKSYPLEVLDSYLACFRVHADSKSSTASSNSIVLTNAQFDEEVKVVQHHSRSKVLIRLHKLHNALIVAAYRQV